jgi:preprotein translocase subunit SecD
MQLVLSWPVRVIVIGLLIFALFVDGAGYWYRLVNHYPLTGSVPGLPPNFGGWQLYIHRGLDLSGGTYLEYQMVDIPPGRSPSELQAQEIAVIKKRIDQLGVNEPVVVPEGNDRIIVELAGVNSARAQEVIGRTTKLVYTTWVPDPKAPAGSPEPGYRPQLTGLTGDMITNATPQLDQNGINWVVAVTFNSQGSDLFGKLTSDNVNACPDSSQNPQCPERFLGLWLGLTQQDIDQWDNPDYMAQITKSPDQGGKLLSNVYTIQPIVGGQAQIQGNFTQQSASDLAIGINSGSLPTGLKVLQSTDVGASLGQDSIKRSLAAGLLGLVIVVIFMVFYYRLPGFLASVALLFYAGVVLALFKVVPVTLSLAGLAGFILSVGMAVDANVLIFERFKEEMRAGRTIAAAVDAGVRRAWPAIRDSNISTMITCAVLYAASPGGSQIKGFAVTLFLGVMISLVSSIIVTHNLLAIVLNFGGVFRQPTALGVQRGRA